MTQFPWIINTIFFLILLGVANIFMPVLFSASQIIFLNIFILVFIASFALFNFLSWYFNVGIVTTKRVVDVDSHALMYKELTAAPLAQIEEVTAKGGGYLEALFNYGDVFVQTGGKDPHIEFLDVPRPADAVKIINDLITTQP